MATISWSLSRICVRNRTFLVHFGDISDSFGTSHQNTRPNSRDMPQSRTKKALLGLDIDLGSREALFALFVCLVTFLWAENMKVKHVVTCLISGVSY